MIHTREEIARYRKELYVCLKNMKDSDGTNSLTNEQASKIAYDTTDGTMDDIMQYHTPQELADLWTM